MKASAHSVKEAECVRLLPFLYFTTPHWFVAQLHKKSVVALNEFRSVGRKGVTIEQATKSVTPSNNEETREMVRITNLLTHSQTSSHSRKQNPDLQNSPLVIPKSLSGGNSLLLGTSVHIDL